MLKKYIVRGNYTVSFEKEVIAESYEEAEGAAYDIEINTEWNGNSVFADDDTRLEADGTVFNVEVEMIKGEEDEEDDEDDD